MWHLPDPKGGFSLCRESSVWHLPDLEGGFSLCCESSVWHLLDPERGLSLCCESSVWQSSGFFTKSYVPFFCDVRTSTFHVDLVSLNECGVEAHLVCCAPAVRPR